MASIVLVVFLLFATNFAVAFYLPRTNHQICPFDVCEDVRSDLGLKEECVFRDIPLTYLPREESNCECLRCSWNVRDKKCMIDRNVEQICRTANGIAILFFWGLSLIALPIVPICMIKANQWRISPSRSVHACFVAPWFGILAGVLFRNGSHRFGIESILMVGFYITSAHLFLVSLAPNINANWRLAANIVSYFGILCWTISSFPYSDLLDSITAVIFQFVSFTAYSIFIFALYLGKYTIIHQDESNHHLDSLRMQLGSIGSFATLFLTLLIYFDSLNWLIALGIILDVISVIMLLIEVYDNTRSVGLYYTNKKAILS